jgi:hypothetical protein
MVVFFGKPTVRKWPAADCLLPGSCSRKQTFQLVKPAGSSLKVAESATSLTERSADLRANPGLGQLRRAAAKLMIT